MKERHDERQRMFDGTGGAERSSTPPLPLDDQSAARFAQLVARWHAGGLKQQEAEQLIAFGKHIRTLRRTCNMSLDLLAQRTGLTPAFLFALEGGMVSVPEARKVVGRLAEGLQTDLTELAAKFNEGSADTSKGSASSSQRNFKEE